MKAFVAALFHESNAFSPIPTSHRSFEELAWQRVSRNAGNAPEYIAGYSELLEEATELGYETVRGPLAFARPSAPMSCQGFGTMRDELLEDLSEARPLDAVLLFLHGAQLAESESDCTGTIVAAVRARVGPDVAIGVLLDLHANVSDSLLHAASIVIACRQYPHVDFPEMARRLARTVHAVATGRCRPAWAFTRIPMLGLFNTTTLEMQLLLERVGEVESRTGFLVSLIHGFPWADSPWTGAGVIVISNDDKAGAIAVAHDLAKAFWQVREATVSRYVLPRAAVQRAAAVLSGPVIVADTSDNAGGGCPSDSTTLLSELLTWDELPCAIGIFWDPVAVQLASQAGEGATLDLRIGGKVSRFSGMPVDVTATVMRVREDVRQAYGSERTLMPLGLSASVRVRNVEIVMNSIRQQTFSPTCFSDLGVDVRSKRIVAVKSTQHFHAQFAPIASDIVYCDSGGLMSQAFSMHAFAHIVRPIWPLDAMLEPQLRTISGGGGQ